MSYACELCGLQLEVLKRTKRRTTYKPCPSCELYNAAVAAVNAAALALARERFPKKDIKHAWLNKYGIFADFDGVCGHVVGTAEEAAAFDELACAARRPYRPKPRERTTFVIVQKDPSLLPRVGYPDQGEKLIESLREWVTSNPEAKIFTFEVPGEHPVSSGWLDWAHDKVDAHDAYVALEEETAQGVLANDERLKAPCKSEAGAHQFERVGSCEDQLFHTAALAGHEYWRECKHCEAWVPDDGEEDEEESDG